MKCDICGKEETYPEKPMRMFDPIDYGWSEMDWLKPIFGPMRDNRKYHLCPECTKKLKKLIKEVKLEE